jgi:hypothetical protein
MSDRIAIRNWIAKHQAKLTSAQAGGYLAREKLDIQDEFERQNTIGDNQAALLMFKQELDALCADMRLASVTVQQQVERKMSGTLKGFLIVFAVITVVVVGVLAAYWPSN